MELDLSGHSYSTGAKLDAFSQLHIARKMGPALPLVEGLVATQNADKDKGILTVLIFSHISDADTEFIIKKCLSVVRRRQDGGKFASVQASDGSLMFDDIPMMDVLHLTVAVIEENLGDFFRSALGNLATVPRG